MRLRSAAAGETGLPEAADVSSSVASATQSAAVAAAGARGDAPRDIGDYELELIYSGESDGGTDSKEAKVKEEPELAKPEPTKSVSRSALSFAGRCDIFGSSDESDPPSPRRSRSADSEKGGGSGDRDDLDGDAIMHQSPGMESFHPQRCLSTSVLGVRFPVGLLRHRMRLVVLLDKAQNINQQLRARLPTICRGCIPAPLALFPASPLFVARYAMDYARVCLLSTRRPTSPSSLHDAVCNAWVRYRGAGRDSDRSKSADTRSKIYVALWE
uniref:Uncharacterized protein n=1 Tax=Hyaloperonospora arabidopsidis (strain Emoy2) TaxID=559515 RepID=M4BBC6_HYAAE